MGSGSRISSQILFFLVVSAVCLSVLEDVLPRVAPPLVALGLVFVAIRLAIHYTRRW